MRFPPVDPAQEISPNLAIVRYMKLASFLLLTQKKIFIPSVKTLQRTDPVEALLPIDVSDIYTEWHKALKPDALEWLHGKASNWDLTFIKDHPEQTAAILHGVWLKQLAVRRSIWCWYAKRTESMGMWNTYGAHGIAIVSSVQNVRAALALPDDALTSVGKVNYVSREPPGPHNKMVDPLWINRPYYFKQDAYEYEQEIRFAIASEPVQLDAEGGILRDVDPALLIDEVLISPYIHLDEALAIKDIIRTLCPYLDDERITISSLLYPGNPKGRMLIWLLKAYPPGMGAPPEHLSGLHEEADHEGKFHALPQVMLEV